MAKVGRVGGAHTLRVVGLGASAGGLEPLREIVGRIPLDSGLAFVVLQHLQPSETPQLANLLASTTVLPVLDASTGQRLSANTIYVVPPHTFASMSRGAIVLRRAESGGRPHHPIDDLFRSLAAALGKHAVGVVLSGTANDGTDGLRAIRAAGGVTFVQDPSTAQFDEMPRNAIDGETTDAILSPAQIGDRLSHLVPVAAPRVPDELSTVGSLARVFEQLRAASGVDFSSYKRSTIERRLARALARHHLTSYDEYSAHLTSHPEEVLALYEDLLIHVTEFFRDAPILEKLATLFADTMRDRTGDAPIRVWVPGCATGEEVYSLAMLLGEKLGESRAIQLFGTDLSERAIEVARLGRYPLAIKAHVSDERLDRFFHRENNGYRIKRQIRERCVFARHDLVSDPPFSRLDLVSCRNLLIYLGSKLQQRVIPIVHYALNQPGFLLLGRAETIGDFSSLFSEVDAEARIYARRPSVRPSVTLSNAGRSSSPIRPQIALRSYSDVQRDVDHVLLARYAPPCVIVNETFDILQYRGHTGLYLEAPPGQPQLNVLRMARGGLATELPLALQRAQRTGRPVRTENIRIRDRRHDHCVHLEVVPIPGTDADRQFLILFEPQPERVAAKAPRQTARGREATEVERLRQELTSAKEYMHSVVTQHLATSEELGLTNEELQSTNEELQSSNEELQTAKEELHSTNEELETVNEELHHRNDQLGEVNDDLLNVLASIEIAMIIVDTERRVRRFTPKARAIVSLIPGDLGRRIADLRPSVVVPELDATIARVIETLEVHESEVEDHATQTFYRMQIRPYLTVDRVTSGAVLSFVDITALRAARDFRAAIVDTVPTPIVVLDADLRVQSANRSFGELFRTSESAIVGRALFDVGDWRSPDMLSLLQRVVGGGPGFMELEVEHGSEAGTRKLCVTANAFPTAGGRRSVLLGIADITERVAARRERDAFLDAVSHELRTPLSAILLWAQALRTLDHDDPQRTKAIETIIDCVKSEARLVDDLLEVALSRSSELSVTLETGDPAPVVASVVHAAAGAASAKEIAISSDIEAGARISMDPRRLTQICTKLIANAIKFTPPHGTVSVSLIRADGHVALRVEDTGPGLTAERLPHVFEPFVREDSSTSRHHGGLGIGLSLVRHLVERHGGTIDVASDGIDRGTRFTVRIPTVASSSDVSPGT